LDLAVDVTGFDVVAIFLGDGKGGFTLQGHYRLDTLPKGLAAGDMNGDGIPDLVSCTKWGYTMQLLLGDGLGGFDSALTLKGDGGPTRLLLRDFNHDGNLDIAVNAPDEGKIILYFGDGKGNFTIPATEIVGYPKNGDLDAGDFNGDNKLDLVTLTSKSLTTSAHAAVLLGDGKGNFTQSAFVSVPRAPSSVKVADLNRDGKLDFVVAGAEPGNTNGNFIATYLGDGAGHFTLKQRISLGAGSLKGDIAIGDFNEDGIPDVAFPVTSTGNPPTQGTTVLIFFGDGYGNLIQGPTITVGKEPHSVATADFNKDGHLDLAVTNRTDGTVSIFLGDGKGNFTLAETLSVISPALNP
jgi:FG-GAP-like repeat